MLATLDDHVPDSEGWVFEVKFDGYRALGYIRDGSVRLLSRTDNDLTDRFEVVAIELGKATSLRLVRVASRFQKEGGIELGMERLFTAIQAIDTAGEPEAAPRNIPPPPTSTAALPLRPPGR